MTKIAVIDYGAGNLGSVAKALKYIGADIDVTSNSSDLINADALVLPGVGAFSACMNGLETIQMAEPVLNFIRTGRPFLGICVGLQMLFDQGEEHGGAPGLGLFAGSVVKFDFDQAKDQYPDKPKIPHIGWNSLSFPKNSELFKGVSEEDRVYFVHSYYAVPEDLSIVSANCRHGYDFCAAIEMNNVFATQFHPEKSGEVGLQILRNFKALVA